MDQFVLWHTCVVFCWNCSFWASLFRIDIRAIWFSCMFYGYLTKKGRGNCITLPCFSKSIELWGAAWCIWQTRPTGTNAREALCKTGNRGVERWPRLCLTEVNWWIHRTDWAMFFTPPQQNCDAIGYVHRMWRHRCPIDSRSIDWLLQRLKCA